MDATFSLLSELRNLLPQVSLTGVRVRSENDVQACAQRNSNTCVEHTDVRRGGKPPRLFFYEVIVLSSTAIDAILELQSISGAIAKKKLIEQNKNDPEFLELLYYALHPLLTYKVSEKVLREARPLLDGEPAYKTIGAVCRDLSSRKALDNLRVRYVKGFLESQPEKEQELYTKLLAKTLRLGVTGKTVNKVVPGLIPEWEVQQAYPIDKYPIRDGTWFSLTQKLNGVRATFYNGQLFARSGELFSGLNHILEKLSEFSEKYVFDGELTLNDPSLSDNEKFRIATGIINSESEDKSSICYTIFDVIPVTEFDLGQSMDSYRDRRKLLNSIAASVESAHVKVLEVLYEGNDQSKIGEYLDQMVREDKEGLMVNLDVPYQCKRHRGILKVKRFYTMDLPIIRCEEGTGRLSGTLGAFALEYKGNEVNVGSGFTDEQRYEFWRNRESLVGTLCEVKYKEISSDKHTKAESLQFPVFITLRTDKSEANYE